jgi:hypothetical protein
MTGRLIRAFINESLLDTEAQRLKPYLSAHTKQMSATGQISVLDMEDSAEAKSWRAAARGYTETSLSERTTKLLRLFAARSAYTGDAITIDSQHDYPMIDAIEPTRYSFCWSNFVAVATSSGHCYMNPTASFDKSP